jgi:RHS repeat-associated protein
MNDVRISQITTILENGAQFTNSYGYDANVPYNSLIDLIERDYNLNILRRTQTTYLKTLNGTDYAGLNVQNSSALHIRDLPLQVSTIGWGNVEEARTTYEYDNYTATANHAALVSRTGISGLDPAFTTSYVTRGNSTAVTRHLLTNGVVTGSVTSYMQYDVAGNVVKTIDGRGSVTTYEFNDRYGGPNGEAQSNTSPSELSSVGQTSFAFPTRITNPMNMVMYFQFDFYLNQAVDVEDINGIVASGYFADALDRPTQVITAANNATLKTQVSYGYDDTNRVVTTTKDSTAYLDNLEKSDTRYDGLGREVETRTYEGGSNYIVTKTNYLGLGNQVSNPYRPWQSETPQWTTTIVDVVGRVKTVTSPDNAVMTTTYNGNEATVTDQTGKKRKSISDSLGRVSYIYEDPLGANHQTVYGYNSLGNLISVGQDYLSQPIRTFVYDSFGRIVSGTNPESGTTTFQYDEAGNLLVKTDARGVSTHYSYDALNRPTRRWYNGSSATSATTHNSPALPAGVGTSLESNYFYDQQALPAGAPTFTRGPSNGALVALTYGTGSSDGTYFGKDPVGRDALKIQRTSGVNYQISVNYNAVGDVSSLVYPSGRSVNYTYDGAGRLQSLNGNLGDGTGRTYSNNITYSPFGGLSREDFGTNTPLYHKLFYNIRGQLFDTRLSSVNDTWDWNRGRHILYYSSNHLWGQSGTDNNGTVRSSETWLPPANATLDQTDTLIEDIYTYDSLNRLKNVTEQKMSVAGGWGNWSQQFRQEYTYDRWGNRTIDAAQTWGVGINNKQFTVNPYYNRLGVPGGQTGLMTYDAVGNLTNDTYTGAGNRTYDAENRITSAWGGANQAQIYSYDAKGERIKRIVNGVETWQIYGFKGELLAEYPISGAANRPQMEYGYRNGELLVSATCRVNVALAANGGVATASSTATGSGFQTTYAINGNNRGPWGNLLEGWNDNTPNVVPDWIQIDFAGSKTINEIDVFGLHDNYTQVNTPTETQTFSLYGLIAFDVQYWNGSSWITVPGGSVTGNNKVWRKFTFSNITTSKIRVHINQVPDSWSRVLEIRAYEPSATGEKIEWTVMDHLGTPRMIVDQTGAYANVRRHDYLPFGEEISAGVGGRTSGFGYVADANRQKFTGYEFDGETGLNYAEARYQSPVQGRFTSTDPVSGTIADPQSWNMYAYVGNNPINRTDPTGMSYFMGSGANDPWIRENAYRVDGFDMSPPGTASNLTDESMLTYTPNSFLMNEGMPQQTTNCSNNDGACPGPTSSGVSVVTSANPYIEVIFWKGTTNGGRDISSALGHVSYIIDGRSYSWEMYVNPRTGKEQWRTERPSTLYTDDRRKLSSGVGYILDFGSPAKNRQFAVALLTAYRDTGGYHLTKNNCAHAFQRAVNKMNLPGVPQNTQIRPSQHEKFLKTHLWQYVTGGTHYKKSK